MTLLPVLAWQNRKVSSAAIPVRRSDTTHICGLAVGFEELGHVEFRSLQDLGLSHVDIVQRVDALFTARQCVNRNKD